MGQPPANRDTQKVTVPDQLRWAEALHNRSIEIIEGVLSDKSTMRQIHESIAEMERGEPGISWRELRANDAAPESPRV